MSEAREIIDTLELEPHPEGGWFRETWRAPAGGGERSGGTAIHFLLERGQGSHWHQVDAAEIWLFQAGDPLRLSFAEADAGPVESVILGNDPLSGQTLQRVIEPGTWQAADPAPIGVHGYSLVACIVVPGFDYAGFTLAPPGWAPGG